jgi:hypothetical protein
VHPLVERLRQPLGAERRVDQRRGLARLERLEPDAAHLGGAEQRTIRGAEFTALRGPPGDQHHEAQGAGLGQQIGEQLVRFARREMKVLDRQHDARGRTRALRERRGEALVEAVALDRLGTARLPACRRVHVDAGAAQGIEHGLEDRAARPRLAHADRRAFDRRQETELAHQA